MSGMQIRDARAGDLQSVADIFDDVVTNTHFSFMLEPPPLDYWTRRLTAVPGRDSFLVATDGQVLGFAYSTSFRPRAAYDGARETSIYLAPWARGGGVGRVLYRTLLDRLSAAGNRLAIAVIAEPNPASGALHLSLSFERTGTLPDVGEKFGRLWSTSLWVCRLSGCAHLARDGTNT